MDDGVGLFKILVVVLAVVYQLFKTFRKKAAGAARESADPTPDSVDPADDEWQPEPIPSPKAETARRDDFRERIRTLVLGGGNAPAATAPAPAPRSIPAADLAQTTAPVETTVSRPPPGGSGAPSLRDLVVSQAILSAPPGLRGSPWARRPGATRP